MTPDTSQILESYLPVFDAIPDDWEDAKVFLTERLKEISNAVNAREIGFFLDEELLSGKAFFPSGVGASNSSPQQFRQIFRKVVDMGGMPAVNKSVPHGIVFDSNFTLIALWGACTDPVNLLAFQFTLGGVPTGNNVQLYMDAVNININCQTDRSAYTRAFVVCEYMQEI